MSEFQWDSGNIKHVIQDYPERANSIEEVQSVFNDPKFRPLPDRVDNRGEQQYNGVGHSNQNRLLFVAFSMRNGQIRPISCRPAGRKARDNYGKDEENPKDGPQADSCD